MNSHRRHKHTSLWWRGLRGKWFTHKPSLKNKTYSLLLLLFCLHVACNSLFFCPLDLKNVNRFINWLRPPQTPFKASQWCHGVQGWWARDPTQVQHRDSTVCILMACWIRARTQSKLSPKITKLNWNIHITLTKLWNRHLVSAWVRNGSTQWSLQSPGSISSCNLCRPLENALDMQTGIQTSVDVNAEAVQALIKGQIKGSLKTWLKLATSIFPNTTTSLVSSLISASLTRNPFRTIQAESFHHLRDNTPT